MLRAVKRYVVVTAGVTTWLAEEATGLPLRRTDAAFDTLHCKVELLPAMMVDGLAVKELIVGQSPTFTVTCA